METKRVGIQTESDKLSLASENYDAQEHDNLQNDGDQVQHQGKNVAKILKKKKNLQYEIQIDSDWFVRTNVVEYNGAKFLSRF